MPTGGTATLDDIQDSPQSAAGTATLGDIAPEPQAAQASPAPPDLTHPAPLAPPPTLSARRGGTTVTDIEPTHAEQDRRFLEAEAEEGRGGVFRGEKTPSLGDIFALGTTAIGLPSGGPAAIERPMPQEVSRGLSEVATPGQRTTGALRLTEQAVQAATPLMGPAALENPLGLATGMAVGTGAGKAAKYGAKALGVGPEGQELAETAGFFAPAIVGGLIKPRVGVAVTPEEVVVRGGVNPPGIGPKVGEVRIPRGPKPKPAAGPALEPPTIEAQPPTRAEVADLMDRAGWDPDKARALAAKEQGQKAAPKTAPVVPTPTQPAEIQAPQVTPSPSAPAPKAPRAVKPNQPAPSLPSLPSAGAEPPKAAPAIVQTAKVEDIQTPPEMARDSGLQKARKEVTQPVEGEVLPPSAEIPKSPIERIRDELRSQYPGNDESRIEAAAKKQLEFEEGREAIMRRGAAIQPQAELPEPKYKFGSTQANIPADSEAHAALEQARSRISESDLAGQGKDVGGNHLTVRYGIKNPEESEGIKKYLQSLPPFEASLGKTQKFPPSEHSDGAAVIQAPVEAPELHQINEELAKHGEFTEPSFKEYKPHATVAYVKPEAAARYVGMSLTAGKKFKVSSIAITDREGKQEEVKLEGKGARPIEGEVIPPKRPGRYDVQSGPYEYKGGQFFKDGKVLDKGEDIADAVAALEPQKMIDGELVDREGKSVTTAHVDQIAPESAKLEPPPAKAQPVAELESKRSTDPIADFLIKRLDKAFAEKRGGLSDAQYAVTRYANSGWVSPSNRADVTKAAGLAESRRAAELGHKEVKAAREAAVPPTSPVPVAGVEKVTSKAEEQFEKDVKKRASQLREKIAQLEKETSSPAAYYQDSAKNASARLERSDRIKELSSLQNELDKIEMANPHEVKPLDPSKLPDREKNKHAFQREYFTQALQPALDAWKAHLGTGFANAVKNGTKGKNTPPEFPEKQLLVDIPGDGHFRVNNDPKVLDRAIRGALRGFAKPSHDLAPKVRGKGPMIAPSEPAKWNYLKRMADEVVDGNTNEEKDAALETIENLLGFTPLKELPKPGAIVEYQGDRYYVNGWDSEHRKMIAVIPEDSEAGRETKKWAEAGRPKDWGKIRLSDLARDAQEAIPLYLAKPVGELPDSKPLTAKELLTSESGSFEPGKLGDAAQTLADYLRSEKEKVAQSRELQSGMYDLESEYNADVLRAVHTIETMNKYMGDKALPDYEAIYHHLENPEGVKLNPSQKSILKDIIAPLMSESDRIYQKLTAGGVPAENYVHRVVKDKGSWFDRILAGSKGTGRGNLLSKSAPQTKSRSMFALESSDGERRVVSLKGGQVTAWDHGTPENLGPILHTEEGKVFEDKDGNIWTLKQATTKEIEAHTDLEYHHNALASALVSFLQLRKAERGFDFIESFKSDPDFKQIAHEQGQANPPSGWKMTDLPQLRGYYFEPHTAEVLDWYSQKLKMEGPGIFDQVGFFMKTAMLINPIMHPMNVAASWGLEKGATGVLPHNWIKMGKAGVKAIRAVTEQNQDFLDALDAGAPLQSQRETTKRLTELFFEQLSDGLQHKEPGMVRLVKAMGFDPDHFAPVVGPLHNFASKVAWLSNDIFFLQSAYEKVADGMELKDALRETARIIPDYRLPTRILDSRALGQLMASRKAFMFAPYHYGLMKTFPEMAKSMFGLHEPLPGQTKAGDVAHGWNMLALMALIAFGLYPLLDEAAKKISGDAKAKFRRSGPFGLVENARLLAAKEKTIPQVTTSVFTPNPLTKAVAEGVFNHELESGHQIYDPQADWKTRLEQFGHYLKGSVSSFSQIQQASETEGGWRKYLYGQLGVTFPRSGAEKVAQNIAAAKSDTKAWTEAQRTKYYDEQRALEALRRGDTAPLLEARMKHIISADEAHGLQRRAKLTWLQDKVHNFSYSEVMQVYNASGATEAQKRELLPIIRRKRDNLLQKHRGAEVEQVDANQ